MGFLGWGGRVCQKKLAEAPSLLLALVLRLSALSFSSQILPQICILVHTAAVSKLEEQDCLQIVRRTSYKMFMVRTPATRCKRTIYLKQDQIKEEMVALFTTQSGERWNDPERAGVGTWGGRGAVKRARGVGHGGAVKRGADPDPGNIAPPHTDGSDERVAG